MKQSKPDSDGRTSWTRSSSGGVVYTVLGLLGEILITLAAICALYVVWQLWWTGVEAERSQADMRQSVSWEDPGSSGKVSIAKPQKGAPPPLPSTTAARRHTTRIWRPT